jgi:cation diffusion facilitator CzcD-associated flavoprotein CzcO
VKVLTEESWRDHDFTGERVGVVADGADAARIVPRLVRTAAAVKVFQRDPAWVSPVRLPVARTLAARLHLRLSVRDPWTRRLLTPGRFGGRDVVLSRHYYEAIRQPHCTLVAWPVYAVTADGVRTAEGVEHRVDTLILTTSARKDVPA